jgi:hypothetical protein
VRKLFMMCALVACAACAQERPDTRLPVARLRESLRVTAISDSAGEPIDLEVGLNGSMFLLLPGLRQIEVYQPDGVLVNRIGGAPQPWQHPNVLGHLGGRLTVYDSVARTFTVIQPNGVAERVVSFPERTGESSTVRAFQQMLLDSSVLIREYDRSGDSGRLLRAHGAKVDTVTTLNRSTTVMFSPKDAMMVRVDAAPAAGDSVGFVVTKTNLLGDTVFSTPWRYHRKRPPQNAYSNAMLGPNGNIMVRHADDGGDVVRWTVFTMLGAPLETLEGPANVQFLSANANHAYGIRTRDGLRELVRYEITR